MLSASPRGGVAHGRDDVAGGAAAAEIAPHLLANLVVRAGSAFLDCADRRHNLPRCAIAALEGIVLDEGCLHRMQPVAFGQALDGGDVAALAHHREGEAGDDTPAV